MENKQQDIHGVYECADCGLDFVIEENEAKFYQSKGFDLPKRCPACRKIRRQNKIDAMNKQ